MSNDSSGSEWELYRYTPSKGAAIALTVLFIVTTLIYSLQVVWDARKASKPEVDNPFDTPVDKCESITAISLGENYKKLTVRSTFSAFIPLFFGCIMEIVGYIARAVSSSNTKEIAPYVIQAVLLLIAPALYAATIYMLFGRLLHVMRCESLMIVSSRFGTSFFVFGDVVSFCLQAAGGGLMATVNGRTTGSNLITAGLVIQIVFFGVFIINEVRFSYTVKLRCATTTESTNVRTSATTTASTNVRTSATTTASINVRTSATTTESTNSSTNATTTASTNVRTSATTTASINVRTSATTTESTNSNTSATTTESTDSNTSATTTASTNSSTNATTTASTNSSTNATTTESTNASAKEDANKDGNAEDNRFHPVTDINKESYKRKGSQMVLLERKKLKAQFPNTSENMNVLQFLGFRSDEIKHLFLYGIDVYFCPEGVFTQYGLCKGCQKMFELCVCWAGQKVSYRRMAWEALAVERECCEMTRNTKNTWKTSSHIMGTL
ncbi:AEL_HP2_G0041320.mRNA.1.CDS.1 [Saccharomyces cerevisiae]|nr:AEL_HP2_G0041320.mRNA.1.CDS.1 [Saccharomyces cerevisiae]CAI6673615.1 AEL_HP2_G0041320.mRNA.1.CDS.1 [Saccharomyces cerevisiae]